MQEELKRAYPNLFWLLWQSTLACYPSSSSALSTSAHLLRQCWWQGKEVNCSEIFSPVITDSGVCCAFNLRTDLKNSTYSQLVTQMKVAEKYDFNILAFVSGKGNICREGANKDLGSNFACR